MQTIFSPIKTSMTSKKTTDSTHTHTQKKNDFRKVKMASVQFTVLQVNIPFAIIVNCPFLT